MKFYYFAPIFAIISICQFHPIVRADELVAAGETFLKDLKPLPEGYAKTLYTEMFFGDFYRVGCGTESLTVRKRNGELVYDCEEVTSFHVKNVRDDTFSSTVTTTKSTLDTHFHPQEISVEEVMKADSGRIERSTYTITIGSHELTLTTKKNGEATAKKIPLKSEFIAYNLEWIFQVAGKPAVDSFLLNELEPQTGEVVPRKCLITPTKVGYTIKAGLLRTKDTMLYVFKDDTLVFFGLEFPAILERVITKEHLEKIKDDVVAGKQLTNDERQVIIEELKEAVIPPP